MKGKEQGVEKTIKDERERKNSKFKDQCVLVKLIKIKVLSQVMNFPVI